MKPLFALLAAVALVASCAPKTQTAQGQVIGATANNLTIVTTANDTLTFSGTEQQVMVGDTIQVAFVASDRQVTDVRLVYRSPEHYLVGQWVEPNPIDLTAVQGFAFYADGTASSINMATLVCSKWAYEHGTLFLMLTSIGNAVEITEQEAFQVIKLDADSLVLSQHGTVLWQLSRQ